MSQHTPTDSDALLSLIQQAKEHYQEPPPAPPKRGKQRDFSALSSLLLAVVAVTTRTFRAAELCRLPARDASLPGALGFPRVPHRTTIGRRLSGLVPEAEAQLCALGERIAGEVAPPDVSQVSAIDGRMYEARGPKWQKGDRSKGRAPGALRDVDTESTWSKSGYRGWVQGYRLVLQGLVWPCLVPLWAAWRADRNGAFVIASVWLYQVVFLSNYRAGRPAAHVKEQLDLARWRIAA